MVLRCLGYRSYTVANRSWMDHKDLLTKRGCAKFGGLGAFFWRFPKTTDKTVEISLISSGASGGSLHGGASFEVEKAHFAAWKNKGPETVPPPEALYDNIVGWGWVSECGCAIYVPRQLTGWQFRAAPWQKDPNYRRGIGVRVKGVTGRDAIVAQ